MFRVCQLKRTLQRASMEKCTIVGGTNTTGRTLLIGRRNAQVASSWQVALMDTNTLLIILIVLLLIGGGGFYGRGRWF
jgi:hypothetical protein